MRRQRQAGRHTQHLLLHTGPAAWLAIDAQVTKQQPRRAPACSPLALTQAPTLDAMKSV